MQAERESGNHARNHHLGVWGVQAPELFHHQEQAEHHRPAGAVEVLPLVPQAHATPGDEMTNDQCPIPNGGAVIGHWELVIPVIIREHVRE